MTEWYYEMSGNRNGPLSRDELRLLFNKAEISEDTLVWNSDFGRVWKHLRETDIVDALAPPPLPATKVSNTYAWLVALTPLVGMAVERVLQDSAPQLQLSASLLFFGYSAAYISFSYLDEQQIRKSGRAREVALLGWIWLVPVYLVQRARALGEKQYLVGVWILAIMASTLISVPELLSGKAYFGLGLPRCDAKASYNQVIDVFNDIPLVKQSGVTASALNNIEEVGSSDKERSCKASVDTSDTRNIAITFKITQRADDFYYEVEIAN